MGEFYNLNKDKIMTDILIMLSKKTGNNFQPTHKNGIIHYIEKRIETLDLSIEEYFDLINVSGYENDELNALMNVSTVNETYFFREEMQYDALKQIIQKKEKISFWSAACSSGEEIYSVKLLCDSMSVPVSLFASDINTEKLEMLKSGSYCTRQSMRTVDGKKYHCLLSPYLKEQQLSFPDTMKKSIESARINLVDFHSYEVLAARKFDVIFLRNMFIYLSIEDRYRILNFISDCYLEDDGYIFVSLNEIAWLEEKYLTKHLEKICVNNVFIFHKRSMNKAEV